MERSSSLQPASAPSVAVLVSGLPRSLLYPAVHASFQRHVRAVLLRSDLFLALVVESSRGRPVEAEAWFADVMSAYAPLHVATIPRLWRVPDLRCPMPAAFTNKVLLQWIALAALYHAVEAAERRRGAQYDWLLRSRPDIVYFGDIPLASLSSRFAWVPAGGMNGHVRVA